MDPESVRIFRLIETADNFVKYAPPGQEKRARERARARYERALELADRTADQKLVAQVRLRIDDIARLEAADANRPLDSAQHRHQDVGSPFLDPGDDPAGGIVQAVSPPEAARRVPPGQRVTHGWPVLHEGPIPPFDKGSWRLILDGDCNEPYGVGYEELRAMPTTELRSDFHCVTGWSKLDNAWRGVQTKRLLQRAQPAPDAAYVLVYAEHGYTANLPLHVLEQEDAMVAWSHNGKELAPEHGFPLRLLVPRLYGWKSVKWVRRIELLTQDKRGFWETRGYHNRADPWREERYAYQEG